SERTCQADGRTRLASYTKGLPSNVSAQAGEKHWHIGGQATAADINRVAHLVNQNEQDETDAGGGAVKESKARILVAGPSLFAAMSLNGTRGSGTQLEVALGAADYGLKAGFVAALDGEVDAD